MSRSITSGRGKGPPYALLTGPFWKVRLSVYPEGLSEPLYVVRRSPVTARHLVPYSGDDGQQIYCGDSPKMALIHVSRWFGQDVTATDLPKQMWPYFGGGARPDK